MAVKIRLMRMGKTSRPTAVVVMDSRPLTVATSISSGTDPRQEPSLIEIDKEKVADWLRKGAQPIEAAAKLEVSGALTEFKIVPEDPHHRRQEGYPPGTGRRRTAAEAEEEAPAASPTGRGRRSCRRGSRRRGRGRVRVRGELSVPKGEIVERVVKYVVKGSSTTSTPST